VRAITNRSDGLFLVAIAISLLLYREWVTLSRPILLYFDEAQYYDWSQALAWGYYSKPPVVAWLIRLTTDLFGDAEWAIKFGAPLLYSGTAGVLYLIGKQITSAKAGFYSALIFLTMPLVSFNSLFITTDAPLLFCWALALWLFLRAQATNNWHFWLIAGGVGGLGLLSKYTFILFPAAFLLYALISRQGRTTLANPRFWIACALAVGLLLPNLWWNYNHDFISFQHTAEISQQSEREPKLSRLVEFWGTQFLVFGPLAMLLLMMRLFTPGAVVQNPQESLLWSLFIPIFLVISIQALTARANINWGAPAYVSASLIVGISLERLQRKNIFRALLAVNVVLMLLLYNYDLVLKALNIESRESNDPYVRIEGWKELSEQVSPHFAAHPNAPLASDSRRVLSYFSYYLTPKQPFPKALKMGDNIRSHFELLYPIDTSQAEQHLFVSETMSAEQLKHYFSVVEGLSRAEVVVRPTLTRSVNVYLVSGFKGY